MIGSEVLGSFLLWPANLVREGPKRIGRLLAVLWTLPTFPNLRHLGGWLHALFAYLFDVVGGPETAQFFIRLLTSTRPLTKEEIQAASDVVGSGSLRFKDVQIASGGAWYLVFRLNNQRAFATWHTINLPQKSFNDLPLLVHELVHTYQYEQCGSVYIGQGLWAQWRKGREAYNYGGSHRLNADYTAGKRYSDYNREQQGQIAQDYYALLQNRENTSAYEPFIDDLRSGLL